MIFFLPCDSQAGGPKHEACRSQIITDELASVLDLSSRHASRLRAVATAPLRAVPWSIACRMSCWRGHAMVVPATTEARSTGCVYLVDVPCLSAAYRAL